MSNGNERNEEHAPRGREEHGARARMERMVSIAKVNEYVSLTQYEVSFGMRARFFAKMSGAFLFQFWRFSNG